MTQRTIVTNIAQLLTMSGQQWESGSAPLGLIPNAAMVVEAGMVVWTGPEEALPAQLRNEADCVDAGGRVVMPGLVECHTHTLFAGDRAHEFELRCIGASYEQIAEAGGGILCTMEATRRASLEDLVATGQKRLDTFLRYGITTVETKSGYGLDLASELRLLEAARVLGGGHCVELVSTFLGAHSVPPEWRTNRQTYVDLVCNQMLPSVAQDRLAEFCDVFCEKGAFSLEETSRIFETAQRLGLALKIHAEQLSHSGATMLGARFGCVSADHLEFIDEQDAQALASSGTVAVLLPGATAFLGKTNFASARLLATNGVPVALSTDFNPGTSHTQNLWLMGTLGAAYYHITPAQALFGMTRAAARALHRQTRLGALLPGMQADFLILEPQRWEQLLYNLGANPVIKVFKKGNLVLDSVTDH